MMAKSANLGAAKNAKQDEFYTQLSDIEKEMRHRERRAENHIWANLYPLYG